MGALLRKAIEKSLTGGKKVNPQDPLVQDTGAWLIDIARNLIKYGGDLL
jgi:hypothetical protein